MAIPPGNPGVAPQQSSADESIDGLLDRLNQLTAEAPLSRNPAPPPPQQRPAQPPQQPQSRPGQPQRAPQQRPPQPGPPQAMNPNPPIAGEKAKPALPDPPQKRGKTRPQPSIAPGQHEAPTEEFFPTEPSTWEEAETNPTECEELIMRYLNVRGEATGQMIADQIKMPFKLISELLNRMKFDQLIHYRGMTKMNDYNISLTDTGRSRARVSSAKCTYYGAAPVTLEAYYSAVTAQSLQHQNPCREDLERAFSDLLINKTMFTKLGAAMNSGKGMFLFGFPGNGKTSIAERVTRAFGETIWIPRSIGIDGEIIRVFDPSQHEEAPVESDGGLLTLNKADQRWVRVKRPTIIVGGELTMDHLELGINPATGINEGPVQLKSNCGTLVIDDFGRQRMTTDELLNRWIVPLEKRYDFLNLPSGKKVQVPFDQLVVFSTNLEPKDLVDDAFLRRIPYKIEVEDPPESDYRELFELMARIMKIPFNQEALDHMIENHYKSVNRPFRMCQPRDLLLQIKNYCLYERKPIEMTIENFDFAAANYFSVM